MNKRAVLTESKYEEFDECDAAAQAIVARTNEAVELVLTCQHVTLAVGALDRALEQRRERGREESCPTIGKKLAETSFEFLAEMVETMSELDEGAAFYGGHLSAFENAYREAQEARPDCAKLIEISATLAATNSLLNYELVALQGQGVTWPNESRDSVLMNLLADRGWSDADIARALCAVQNSEIDIDKVRIATGRARRRRQKQNRGASTDGERREMRDSAKDSGLTSGWGPREDELIEWLGAVGLAFTKSGISGDTNFIRKAD